MIGTLNSIQTLTRFAGIINTFVSGSVSAVSSIRPSAFGTSIGADFMCLIRNNMRKMWLDPKHWPVPTTRLLTFLRLYSPDEDGTSPTSEAYEPVILFTPAELEEHERKVREAATSLVESAEVPPDWDGDFANLIGVANIRL